ncbi:DNA/RNA non-specific endonuclease [Limosilactobacillus reuteri]|uniref:DNA/RNA non-specific endonuclease n=1 Tax=Limosilactobacillus reuteri TaxID=1598 RepID=UPI000F4EBB94|nr:DNA/RNA non-specific endonuclease [Limosilactobacillus reuteri]MDZ5437545.1 DNA/RNA non-specific endonuclease [Limosilactobacillus reuteri]ROV63173.1 DNA/RNA non-specific endonuclease [Limosilactobacillus reuteri]
MKRTHLWKILELIAVLGVLLTGCVNRPNPLTQPNSRNSSSLVSEQSNNSALNPRDSGQSTNLSSTATNDYGGITQTQIDELATKNFQSGQSAIIQVNNGRSTLNPNSWHSNKVIYSALDKLNRTSSPNTGFLEEHNRANEELRVRQTVDPTAWHNNHGRGQIYNRGHMIAYSISAGINQDGNYDPNSTSGDQNNPKNLFTQTAFSNQKLQTIYEAKVRKAIENDHKVIYQVTPIFRGNELMARGVNLQAVSTDRSLDFNVYIFNVQPGYSFDYSNGNAIVDSEMRVPTPPSSPVFNNE